MGLPAELETSETTKGTDFYSILPASYLLHLNANTAPSHLRMYSISALAAVAQGIRVDRERERITEAVDDGGFTGIRQRFGKRETEREAGRGTPRSLAVSREAQRLSPFHR